MANKKAYLFGCLRNEVLNQARDQDRCAGFESEHAWFRPPDRDCAGEQSLRHALALPPEQWEIIFLHVWGELTFSGMAKVLDVSSTAVASRYRYGLAKLGEQLGPRRHLVQSLDDEKFEKYPKKFRPLVPEVISQLRSIDKGRARRRNAA